MPAPVGYSGKPLAAKLGYAAGMRVHTIGAPTQYEALLGALPAGVTFVESVSPDVHLVHVFATTRAELAQTLHTVDAHLAPGASLWVSWPKKASKVATDIVEDTIREIALPMGLVDVKVCAVDAVWSGLKLVRRKSLR